MRANQSSVKEGNFCAFSDSETPKVSAVRVKPVDLKAASFCLSENNEKLMQDTSAFQIPSGGLKCLMCLRWQDEQKIGTEHEILHQLLAEISRGCRAGLVSVLL